MSDDKTTRIPHELNISEALKSYAEAINKTLDELTTLEKQQAIFNVVLAWGEQEQI